MSIPIHILRKLEVVENIVPKKYRLPFRYFGQKIVLALEPEMKLLPDLIPANKVSIDIGANKGIYAYPLSKISRHVFCFEPISELCEYISNYESNKITVYNVGLSDKVGDLHLNIPKKNNSLVTTRASFINTSESFEQRKVSVHKLDDYDFKDIGFIKIDVEGVEENVINGAINTIRACRPVMLVEVVVKQYDFKRCSEFISNIIQMGYVPMVLRKELSVIDVKEFCVDVSFNGNVFFMPKERIKT